MTLNPNWFLNATGQFTQIGSGQVAISTTTTTGFLTYLTKATTVDISPPTTAFTDIISVTQGTSGTWLATATITAFSASNINFFPRLWDGTTVFVSATNPNGQVGFHVATSISGIIANPVGNIRLSIAATAAYTVKFNFSGNSLDTSMTALRIG